MDGDTIDVVIRCGFSITVDQRLRLLGVNTPERGEEGYQEAKDFVIHELLGKDILIQTRKTDSFGRYLANIFIEDGNSEYCFNNLLIVNGLAKPYYK